jgi:hypothetical protein
MNQVHHRIYPNQIQETDLKGEENENKRKLPETVSSKHRFLS